MDWVGVGHVIDGALLGRVNLLVGVKQRGKILRRIKEEKC